MVVLNGSHGASYQQPLIMPSNTTTISGESLKSKTMDSSVKGKSPLGINKAQVILQALRKTPDLNNCNPALTNGNQTTTDGANGGNLPAMPNQPTNGLTMKAADVVVVKKRKGRPPKAAATLKASAKVKNAAAKSTKTMQSKVLLDNVIPFITCNLCKGYLIDATTIVECLHTFCHSCIMIHLRQKQYCPCCELMINKSKPNIKPDAIRQAIVYKLVPGLYEKEILRRQEFYRAHPDEAKLATPEQRGEDTENLIFSPTENISLSIEYAEDTKDLDGVWSTPKYLQCPASFTVNSISKFIMMKIGMDSNKFVVDISYKVKTIVLADYYTLMDVAYIYTWKREAPMRFYFSVRTKETTNEELPEVPFRRSPSLANNALPSLLATPATGAVAVVDINRQDSVTSDKPSVTRNSNNNNNSAVPPPNCAPPTVETKLKLKKVDDNQRVSDKKRVVYMVQNSEADNEPKISAAAAYALLPHESPAVGVNSPTPQSQLSNGGGGSGATQSKTTTVAKQERTAAEGTPRYRSLVEKENAKMKKLMQSLSEEKKLMKMRKREAMKEAAAAAATLNNNATATATTEKKCETLKFKITKNDSGLMVIQNSAEPKDVLSIIGSVANCDTNDEYKKSLFLNSFNLKPKSAVPEKDEKLDSAKPKPLDSKKSISFGFSSYDFPKSGGKDKDKESPAHLPKAESVKQKSPPNPPTVEKPKKSRKLSSYVKIAPKEQQQSIPTPVPEKKIAPNIITSTTATVSNKNNLKTVNLPIMAPPPIPQPQVRPPPNGSIYAFLHSNPSHKQLFKPMGAPGFAHTQFQTMPSPVYMTNANAGSTPIYSPNSPQYSPNFSLPQHQQFKYTKFPTYMTSFSIPSSSPLTSTPPTNTVGISSGKVPEPVAARTKKDQKLPNNSGIVNKGVSYLNNLPPPPIFSPSSGMSITTTTTTMLPPPIPSLLHPPPLAVLPKRSPETEVNTGKRKITNSPVSAMDGLFPGLLPAKPQSPGTREDPPEKQRKVQSLLDSCNITFPASLSITIANETEDSDKSGLHNNKLKNPVNNYIEILKIPPSDPANCSPDQNNKFPVSTASVMQQQQQQQPKPPHNSPATKTTSATMGKQNNPNTFAASSSSQSVSAMKPPTLPTTTTAASNAALMRMGSGSLSMSITPAISSNIMRLINGKEPKDCSLSVPDLKRRSPPIEMTAVKRPTPSPPQSLSKPNMNSALQQVTSTASDGNKKTTKSVPKLMPKLNPIEKVANSKQTPPPQKQQQQVKQQVMSPTPPPSANNAAAVAAAAIANAKETFQREFMKFTNDKEEDDGKILAPKKPATGSKTIAKEGVKPLSDKDVSHKMPRKSPVKIKPKANVPEKKQPATNNNKQQFAESRMNPPAIAPFPLLNHQHQQQQQQQQQQQGQQEFAAAALMKMAIEFQHQQKLAALQHSQSQFPTVLGDLMMSSNPVPMFNNPTPPVAPAPQQQQQQQQINSLIQQACLMEHFERMKRAGKEALERYAQNIQQEQKMVAQKEARKTPSPKPPKEKATKKKQADKSPSPVPSKVLVKEDTKKSPEILLGSGAAVNNKSEDLKTSPKPLQLNNNNNNNNHAKLANIKEDEKKDVKA